MTKLRDWMLLLFVVLVPTTIVFWRHTGTRLDKVALWPHRVQIPLSRLYVRAPALTEVRLWGNAVEMQGLFSRKATLCIDYEGKVLCMPGRIPSPR